MPILGSGFVGSHFEPEAIVRIRGAIVPAAMRPPRLRGPPLGGRPSDGGTHIDSDGSQGSRGVKGTPLASPPLKEGQLVGSFC